MDRRTFGHPEWRNTNSFAIDWPLFEASSFILLIHPKNVLLVPALTADWDTL